MISLPTIISYILGKCSVADYPAAGMSDTIDALGLQIERPRLINNMLIWQMTASHLATRQHPLIQRATT